MPMLLEIKRADLLAQSMYQRDEKLALVDRYEKQYNACVEASTCLQKKDMALNGSDLIAMGMKPGKEMGEVIEQLFEAVLDDPNLNEKEKLQELAHKFITPFIR